ncbi:tyrosine-type recombinase/integrase [Paraburkholderia nodosa]|uniref:tyrosine-type recombinase/integrase n=1 Tax=Paraburkholderia nodosa TaxID=392320 RepID=UPI000486A0C4|nr:tyrosine-type recombinase/integrase [Paraburkholderia nodosa]
MSKRRAEIIRKGQRLVDYYVHVNRTTHPATITLFDFSGRIIESPTRWLADKEYTYADGTRETFGRYVGYFLRWMRRKGALTRLTSDEVLRTCNRDHIKSWIEHSTKVTKLESSTVHQRESVLAKFIEWLEENHLRDESDTPYRSGKLITTEDHRQLPQGISAEKFKETLAGYYNESERCAMHTMYDTGLRISELCRMKNADLPDDACHDSASGFLPIRIRGSKGSGGKIVERFSIISLPVLARIRKYHSSDAAYGRVYPERHARENLTFLSATGKPLSRESVHKQLKRAARRAGIDPETIRTHTPRHSFSIEVLMAHDVHKEPGTRYAMLTNFLGHRDPKSTKVYSKVNPEVLESMRKELFSKYEVARTIAEETRLPPLKHREKRGHAQ